MSLPSRERGLKLQAWLLPLQMSLSLPSRERGLKSSWSEYYTQIPWSLPSRERGLKWFVGIRPLARLAGRSLRGSVD